MLTPYNQLQALQNCVDNYFVKYTNMGSYVGFFCVTFTVNDNCHIVESPFVPSCHSYVIPIPQKAENIKVVIYHADEHNAYSLISCTSYMQARPISLTSFGTLVYAWAKEVNANGFGEGILSVPPPSLYSPMPHHHCSPMYGSMVHGGYHQGVPPMGAPVCTPIYNPNINCHC